MPTRDTLPANDSLAFRVMNEIGIISQLGTFNPFRVAFREWIGIGRDLARAKSLRDVAGYVFGPPGWSPDGSRKTSASIKAAWAAQRAAATPAE